MNERRVAHAVRRLDLNVTLDHLQLHRRRGSGSHRQAGGHGDRYEFASRQLVRLILLIVFFISHVCLLGFAPVRAGCGTLAESVTHMGASRT